MSVWGRLGVRELQRRPELGEEHADPRSERCIAGAEAGEEQRWPEAGEEDAAASGQIHPIPRSEKEAPAWIWPASTMPVRRRRLGLGSDGVRGRRREHGRGGPHPFPSADLQGRREGGGGGEEREPNP